MMHATISEIIFEVSEDKTDGGYFVGAGFKPAFPGHPRKNTMMHSTISEIIFEVSEDKTDGGYFVGAGFKPAFPGHPRKNTMMHSTISEIIFEVSEDEVDGGYSASALGHGIHTQGESVEELRRNVKEAVDCYFDATMKRPALVRLHCNTPIRRSRESLPRTPIRGGNPVPGHELA